MRNFRLFWVGETTSRLGSSIGSTAVPLVALTVLHASVFTISALMAAAWLPWVVIGLPVGALVDRLPRRKIMIAADTVSACSFASVPVAAWLGVLTSAQLLIVALLGGIASVFFKTSYQPFLPALLEQRQLLDGNAKLQGSEQAANVAGPGAAGVIAQLAGATLGVLADAVSFVVSAVCLLAIRASEPPPAAKRRRLRHEIAEGLAVVVRDPLLRVTTIYGALSNLTLVGFQAVQVVFLVRIVGLSSGVTGVLLAMTSLGGVLGAALARPAARRLGTARAVLLGRLTFTPAGLLIPLAAKGPALALFILGSVVLIAAIVAGNVIWQGWMQSFYPSRMLGRVSATVQVLNFGSIPLGALLGGVLASHFGVRPTLWTMLIGLVLVSAVLLVGPLRTMRDLPAHYPDPANSPTPTPPQPTRAPAPGG